MTLTDLRTSNVGAWLGVGFNIYGSYDLLASSLNAQVYDPRRAKTKDVEPFGLLPEYVMWRPLSIKEAFTATGESRESFQGAYAARGSVDVSVGAFTGHVEMAYGRKVSESSHYSFANYSFLDIAGNLVLSTDQSEKYLSEEFQAAVAALPGTADPKDPQTLARFSDFFQKYGTYFVSQVTLGATLEYYKAISHSESLSSESIAAKASASYKGLFISGKASAEMSSDEEWKTYNSSQHTRIRVIGGGSEESSMIAGVDVNSTATMSPETVAKYNKWLATVATHPAPMQFKLTGIWEVCGAKRKLVEDTFREYGKLTRPLVHIETKSPVTISDYSPAIFVNGREIPVERPVRPVGKDNWGVHAIVIDRRQPDKDGVKHSKEYSLVTENTTGVYRTILQDLAPFRNGDYFLILCTYGLPAFIVPINDLIKAMQEAGAGAGLRAWTTFSGATFNVQAANYIMMGIMGSGPGAAVEVFNSQSWGDKPIPASLEVYLYSLGPGKPYVLGQALQGLGGLIGAIENSDNWRSASTDRLLAGDRSDCPAPV